MSKRNKQNTADLIVSVESRKGGVGKTTAALCLGRLLLKRGYAVFVLDLDVTGTNAADIADSPFWVKDIHTIRDWPMAGENSKCKSPPVNLLTLFEGCFMAGNAVPSFSLSLNDKGHMRIDLIKANVLGSQIYKIDKAEANDHTGAPYNDKSTTCIERPGILFDDLHSLWLLEFVKQLIGDFARVTACGTPVKTAIILDNSPGYVGIAPAIHEWLTDCGPAIGKFLNVTSLDAQDLGACERAIDALHGTYTRKWKTSRLFVDAGSSGEGICVTKDQEAFFMQLATSAKAESGTDDPLAFYRFAKRNKVAPQQKDESGEGFCINPNRYIAAVINRVPRAVKAGRLVYDYAPVPLRGETTLGRLLCCNERGQVGRERMISYDEYIENQFLLQSMQRGQRRSKGRIHRLVESLEMAEHELRAGTQETDAHLTSLVAMAFEDHERLRAQLVRANDIVSRARSAVDDAGLGHLARLIDDEWLPGSILPGFRSALSGFLRESDLPHFDMVPTNYEGAPLNPQEHSFVMYLKQHIHKEMRQFRGPVVQPDYERTVDLLADVLAGLVGLSMTSPIWHSPFEKEIAGLFAGVLAIEFDHWNKKGNERRSRSGLQGFLAQESFREGQIKAENMEFMHSQFFRQHMMREGESGFADFYRSCSSAQARLLDFAADSYFLLQLLQFIVRGEMEEGMLFPFVRGIAEDVIVKKTLSHEEAPKRMAKAVQAAEYFREFDNVLEKVLVDWGVGNA